MKLLLDTCTVLWIALDAEELSPNARQLYRDPQNECWLSAVSAWEITTKYMLGKLPLPSPPEELIAEIRREGCIETLPLEEAATFQLPRLPNLHRDPFDRMLICQAITKGLTILTPDPDIRRYPVATAW